MEFGNERKSRRKLLLQIAQNLRIFSSKTLHDLRSDDDLRLERTLFNLGFLE